MALDNILRVIRADTDSEIRDLDAAAAAEVAAIVSRAQAEARRVGHDIESSADLIADRDVVRITDRARLDARRATLRSIETAYQDALGEVRARLGTLRHTAEYQATFAALLDEALVVLDDPTGVSVDPDDVALARELLIERGRVELAVEAGRSCAGGLDLVSGDGEVVRNTFEARLQRADGRLRSLVVPHLLDGAST